MNKLYERLDVLLTTDTITKRADLICRQTIKQFVNEQNADKYVMLITHLAMAVTRIERQKPLLAPSEVAMKEVYNSPFLHQAEQNMLWIESNLQMGLPKEEKEFLLMHFVSVLS